MKTKIKRVSKSTLAVILAIMMVFSTMLVGIISVNAVDDTGTFYLWYSTDESKNNPSDWTAPTATMTKCEGGYYSTFSDITAYKPIYFFISTSNNKESISSSQVWKSQNFNTFTNELSDYSDGCADKDFGGIHYQVLKYKTLINTLYIVYNPKVDSVTVTTTKPTATSGSTYTVTNNATDKVSVVGSSTGLSKDAEVKIEPVDSNKKITAATIKDAKSNSVPIVTNDSDGTATFKMPASNVTISSVTLENKTTEPTTVAPTTAPAPGTTYYFACYNGGNTYQDMYDSETGKFLHKMTSTEFNYDRGQFKITTSTETHYYEGVGDKASTDDYNYCVNQHNPVIERSTTLVNENITVVNRGGGEGCYYNIQISSSKYEYMIEFTPDTSDPLTGTIKVWTVDDYDNQTPSGLAKPTITVPTSVQPGGEVKAVIANPTDYIKDGAVLEGLKFTYTVTPSDDSTVNPTPSSSKKLPGTNDTITFTASDTVNTTYTIRVTAKTTEYAEGVESVAYTVKVQLIPNAQEGRIYAYAKDVKTGFQPDAWVAAEEAKEPQPIYKTNGQLDTTTYPTLGGTLATASEFRIFLPTTADTNKVVLYNNYSEAITIFGETIDPYGCKEVSYTADRKTSFTVGSATKYITIYNSDAEAAIYVNYSGINSDNVPEMLTKLQTKEDEIKSPTGAIADSTGVSSPTIKKFKGRGNTTWNDTDKKSFNITYKNNVTISGLTGNKFSLLANFKEPSLARNLITYEMGDAMFGKNVYSPDCRTADLYIDGMYMGSYLLCQKVEVGTGNLVSGIKEVEVDNITTDTLPANFDFLIEVDSNATDSADFYVTSTSGQKITIKSPEYLQSDLKDKYSPDVAEAIKNYVKDKYDRLYNVLNNPTSTKAELSAVIDLDSLARYYALNEFVKNFDVGVTSCYFNYNSSKGIFYASPVWDYDVSTGNVDKGEDYTKADGDWTINKDKDNANNANIMRSVANNANVQAAVRAIWTTEFYSKLISWLNSEKTEVSKILPNTARNNFVKWSSPAGENIGKYNETVSLKTSLDCYDYDVSNHSVTSSTTKYYNEDGNTLSHQVDFVFDWLRTRAAWLTQKYNTYYISGLDDTSWTGSTHTMSNNNGVNTYEITNLPAGEYQFKISSDGFDSRNSTAFSISYSPEMKTANYTENSEKISSCSISKDEFYNFTFKLDTPVTESNKLYIIYNQLENTVTLSDTRTTSTPPTVSLEKSTNLENEQIVAGTSVTLTATVGPATKEDVAVTGDYTVELLRDGASIPLYSSQTVTFNDGTTQSVEFKTDLVGTSQSYTVKVTKADDSTITAVSNSVSYNQTGIRNQKIYFDPSFTWGGQITAATTVKMTVGTDEYIMSINTDELHGLAKGVFVTKVTAETITAINSGSNVTFTIINDDNEVDSISTSATGSSNHAQVTDGYIYTYTTEIDNKNNPKTSQWCKYNVPVEESYPDVKTNDGKPVTDYATFVEYLQNNTSNNIIYFNNASSQWYNVYVYKWNDGVNVYPMEKLKGFDNIWYIDRNKYGITTESFLFKDRDTETFGNDYQQSVDIVDDQVYLDEIGSSNKLTVSLGTNFNNKPNPVFVTTSFQNISQRIGDSGNNNSNYIKNRAFTKAWQNLYAYLVTTTIKTQNVTFYFDLHSSDADMVTLNYSVKSDYDYDPGTTTLNLSRQGDSTVYAANMLVPYCDGNIVLNFDSFTVKTGETSTTNPIPMYSKAQPAFNCITTQEIWYEYSQSGITYEQTSGGTTTPTEHPTYYFTDTSNDSYNTYELQYSANYAYYEVNNSSVKFKIGTGTTGDDRFTYGFDQVDNDRVDALQLTNPTAGQSEDYKDIAFENTGGIEKYYIIIEYPKTDGEAPVIYATTTLPTDTPSVPDTPTDVTDHCGILSYKSATATFESETGGTMAKPIIKLTNGYNSTSTVDTGITTLDASTGVYTVKYASTQSTLSNKTGAVTSYYAITSEDTSTYGYNFSAWTKDGAILQSGDNTKIVTADNKKSSELTDKVTNSEISAYVAQWSKVEKVEYTFVYNYYVYDTKTTLNGKTLEYDPAKPFATELGSYTVYVQLDKGVGNDAITAAYLANAPIIDSVYFDYEFSSTATPSTVVSVGNTNNAEKNVLNEPVIADTTVTSTGVITGVKKYTLTVNNDDGLVDTNDYQYQNIAEYTVDNVDSKKTVVWYNNGVAVATGNTYKFRITSNTNLTYEIYSSDDPKVTDAKLTHTNVNDATYELYTVDTTEKVRFRITVDNFFGTYNTTDAEGNSITKTYESTDVVEYGMLYFLCDKDGKPNNSAISNSNIIAEETLINAANGISTGISRKQITPKQVNSFFKYNFTVSLTNNAANQNKYYRFYSYIKFTDGTVIISDNSTIASIAKISL